MKVAALLLLLLAAMVCTAQQPGSEKKDPVELEIRGVLVEAGVLQPISDAEVSLVRLSNGGPRIVSAFIPKDVVQTTKTDSGGAFRFEVGDLGNYSLEVKKEGYGAAGPIWEGYRTSATVTLDKQHLKREVRFLLARPGEITARIVDEETRAPVPGLTMMAGPYSYLRGRPVARYGGVATTDSEGRFTVRGLFPADYVVSGRSRTYLQEESNGIQDTARRNEERLLTTFSEKDFETVDWVYQPLWWPGGGSSLSSASPIPLISGGLMDLGVLRVRRVPVYRVRVSTLASTCSPGDMVGLDVVTIDSASSSRTGGGGVGTAPCGGEFLLRGFSPGSYRLEGAVENRKRAEREKGSVPLQIVDKNIVVSLSLGRGVDVDGRVVLAEGSSSPELRKIQVYLDTPRRLSFLDDEANPVDSAGRFRIVNAAIGDQWLAFQGLPKPYYVKEVRYNGHVITGSVLPTDGSAPSHSLTITVDDKSGIVSGAVTDRDKPVSEPHVVMARWPLGELDQYTPLLTLTGDEKGRFQFAGLAPGEYRVLAVALPMKSELEKPGVLERLLAAAPKVDVGPRGLLNLTLPLTGLR
jgi:hypothetical protein